MSTYNKVKLCYWYVCMHGCFCACVYVYANVAIYTHFRFNKCLDVAKRLSLRDRKVVEQFNSIVVDFCNALWRCLIFVERQSECETLGFQFTRFDRH